MPLKCCNLGEQIKLKEFIKLTINSIDDFFIFFKVKNELCAEASERCGHSTGVGLFQLVLILVS